MSGNVSPPLGALFARPWQRKTPCYYVVHTRFVQPVAVQPYIKALQYSRGFGSYRFLLTWRYFVPYYYRYEVSIYLPPCTGAEARRTAHTVRHSQSHARPSSLDRPTSNSIQDRL